MSKPSQCAKIAKGNFSVLDILVCVNGWCCLCTCQKPLSFIYNMTCVRNIERFFWSTSQVEAMVYAIGKRGGGRGISKNVHLEGIDLEHSFVSFSHLPSFFRSRFICATSNVHLICRYLFNLHSRNLTSQLLPFPFQRSWSSLHRNHPLCHDRYSLSHPFHFPILKFRNLLVQIEIAHIYQHTLTPHS